MNVTGQGDARETHGCSRLLESSRCPEYTECLLGDCSEQGLAVILGMRTALEHGDAPRAIWPPLTSRSSLGVNTLIEFHVLARHILLQNGALWHRITMLPYFLPCSSCSSSSKLSGRETVERWHFLYYVDKKESRDLHLLEGSGSPIGGEGGVFGHVLDHQLL